MEITYADKVSLINDETIPNENKVTDADMNEIKKAVNINARILTEAKEDISELQAENTLLKSQIPNGQAVGENITLTDSSNLPYEKFNIGGKSVQDGTPTPETPVEIRSVGDDGTIVIKQSRKNLFDKNKSAIIQGAKKTVLPTGVKVVITSEGQYKYIGIELGGSELLGKEITLGATITPSANNESLINIRYGNSNGEVASSGILLEGVGTKSVTGKIADVFPDNCDRVYALLYGNKAGTGNVDDYIEYTNVMVVIGDTLGDYEEHKENNYVFQISEPLRSLPNGVRDTIEEDGIHRRVGSIVLDGSDDEGWALTTYDNLFMIIIKNYKSQYAYCSNFKVIINNKITYNESAAITLNNGEIAFRSGTTKDRLYLKSIDFSTVDEVKEYLSANPTTLFYELAEEIIEPYTDNQLQNATSYKNITHIFSTDEVSPVFDITYKKDLETLFNNLNSALVQGGM